MKTKTTKSKRLYGLLSELSPELLADALPEASNSPPLSPPIHFKRPHIRRIGRAIAIYAACAMLFLGVLFLLPRLINQQDLQLTDPPALTSSPDYPTDVNEYWDVTTLTPAPKRNIFPCIESYVPAPSLKLGTLDPLTIEFTYQRVRNICDIGNHNIHAYQTDGIDYLEVYLYGAWYEVPRIDPPAAPSSAFFPMEEDVPIQKDFQFVYGELPPGNYRAVVSFATIAGNNYVTEGYVYAEFVIENRPIDDLPEDYFRPDLVWANEKQDPRKKDALKGDYVSVEFEFVSDPHAVYAIYLTSDFDGSYIYLPEDKIFQGRSYQLSGWRKVLGAETTYFRILEDDDITLYAATRQQIEAFFRSLNETDANDDIPQASSVRIHLAYQTIHDLYANGNWNPSALQPAVTEEDSLCVSSTHASPSVVKQSEQSEIELTIEWADDDCYKHFIAEYYPTYYLWRLEVNLNDQWYMVPVKDPNALIEILIATNVKTREKLTASFPISESLYGYLPAGNYRVSISIGGQCPQIGIGGHGYDIINSITYVPFTISD